MIGPQMFNRWLTPALEAEAAIVKHAIYHWGGPGARVWRTPDEVKAIHRELDPARAFYCAKAARQGQAEALLGWLAGDT